MRDVAGDMGRFAAAEQESLEVDADQTSPRVFLRRARLRDGTPTAGYPFDMPVVRGIDAIPFGAVTLFVGDNGTGKSTIAEAIAVAAGFNAEGGSRNLNFATLPTHSSLHSHLELVWRRRPNWGWFLRAETFYGMASHITLDNDPKTGLAGLFPGFHNESHGESFLDLALGRFRSPGLYVLDEPESALSLQGQLKLLRIMHDSVRVGGQFIVATHSPILMAMPDATVVQFDDDGLSVVAYDELPVVQLWRQFLNEPQSFLRHLFAD